MLSAEVTSQEILQKSLPEYEYKGSPDVFAAMHMKRRLIQEKRFAEAKAVGKILIINEGGGQGVVNEAGANEALYEEDMFDGVINIVIGASGGTVVATNSVTGNKKAMKMFHDNCEKTFFAFSNIVRPFREMERSDDTSRLGRIKQNVAAFLHALREPKGIVNLTGFRKTLDEHSATLADLKKVSPEVYGYVVNADTNELELVDLKKLDSDKELNDAIFASCCMPEIGDQKIATLRGKRYIDGSVRGIDIQEVIEKFNPAYVLVLRSRPLESTPQDPFTNVLESFEKFREGISDDFFADIADTLVKMQHMRRGIEGSVASVLEALSNLPGIQGSVTRREGLRSFQAGLKRTSETLNLLWKSPQGVKLGIFAPREVTVGVLCMDHDKIDAATKGSRLAMQHLLTEHREFEETFDEQKESA